MRRALLITSLSGIILGAAWIIIALGYSFGTLEKPGPGLYPVLVGSIMVLGAIGCGFDARSSSAQQQIDDWPLKEGWRRILALLISIAMYIVLLPFAGHVVAGLIPAIVTLQIMREYRWYVNAGMAVAMTIGLYYLFKMLSIPMIQGIWFN